VFEFSAAPIAAVIANDVLIDVLADLIANSGTGEETGYGSSQSPGENAEAGAYDRDNRANGSSGDCTCGGTIVASGPPVMPPTAVPTFWVVRRLSNQTEHLCKPLFFENFPGCPISVLLPWPFVNQLDGPC